jgi:hypothetical protein
MAVRMTAIKSDSHLENRLSGCFNWYARLGSNQRLSAPEADALSTELRARIKT